MFCTNCPTKNTCKSICPAVNRILKKSNIKAANFIRPEVSKEKRRDGEGRSREISVSDISSVAIQRAIHLRGDKKKIKKYDETA